MEVNHATCLFIIKEENIEIVEHTFNIEFKQEINEVFNVNPPNDLIRNINSISPVKQEINVDSSSYPIIEANVSINRENNAYNVHSSNFGNKLKYLKKKRRQNKVQGLSLNGKNIKKQDTVNGIIICVICGNLYTKQVEYFSHYSIHHSLRPKKLCKTQLYKRDIGNLTYLKNEDAKYDIEIVEHELKKELEEMRNCARNINSISAVEQDINVNSSSDPIIEANVSINRENNAYNVHSSNFGNKLKYSKKESWQNKLKGLSLNGKNIKKQDTVNGILICVICGNLYTNQVEYFSHYSIHHSSIRLKKLCTIQLYRGDIDNLTFLNEDAKYDIEIVEHELKKELEETRKCAQFNSIENDKPNSCEIVEYTQLCCKNPFKCEICGNAFSLKSKLIIHSRCHPEEKPCEICPKSSLEDDWKKRLRCYTIEKPFKCKICLKYFSKKIQLDIHLRCHPEENPFNCDICLKTFSSKKGLNTHLRYHNRKKPLKCEICLKLFSSKNELIIHLRSHNGEKPFKCEFCLKYFSQKSSLNTHLRCHTGEKPFNCVICSKSFSNKTGLVTHIRCHTGEKPFKCEFCLKYFSQKSSLNTHLRCHTGEKPFNCVICSKLFSNKTGLVTHLRHHNGEKPFKCETCLKYFSQKSSLNTHLRCHTGEKPFNCGICPKSFSNKTGLVIHIRCHTREKPFKCEFCLKYFSQKSSLNTHLRCHTRGKPFIRICDVTREENHSIVTSV